MRQFYSKKYIEHQVYFFFYQNLYTSVRLNRFCYNIDLNASCTKIKTLFHIVLFSILHMINGKYCKVIL